jgi:hypothetical protein
VPKSSVAERAPKGKGTGACLGLSEARSVDKPRQRRFVDLHLAFVLMIVLSTTACGSVGTQSTSQSTQNGSERTIAEPLTGSAKDYERARFDDPTHIDNKWLPLKPGAQFVYEGSTFIVEEKRREKHRVVFTVTDLTKVINGLRTLVVWDRDYSGGQLVETELAFHVQDNDGNVWHLGQYPEEYENGKFAKAPAWIVGRKGAQAGISMKAEPQLGTPSYAQGYAPPPLNWDDRARVYKVGQKVCVPVDCYENALVTEEFEPSIPGVYQLKYYASGVGNIRVSWRGKKQDERETLELVDLKHLSPEALAKVRKKVMALDRRAYERSEVYRDTSPVEPLQGRQ